MKEDETKGLLVSWVNIDEAYRVEFEKWHNCEHMAERISIPGFHVGRRYRGIDRAPDFLITYETSDLNALVSQPYLDSLNHPTPWAREALSHFRDTVRTLYSLLATSGKKSPTDSPYVFVDSFNCARGSEQEGIQWYREEYLPRISATPGVHRGRLYESQSEMSSIMTEERKLHGAGPAKQRFLALYEISSPDLVTSRDWKGSHLSSEHDEKMAKKMENVTRELYWLDFVMYAPKTE